MPDILLVFIGAAIGGVGVWFWAGRRMREQLQADLADASRKSSRAIDWVKSEAAVQIERRDQQIATLQARIDDREHSVEQIRSRLEADLALAHRDRSQWESQTTELSQRAEDLGAQVRGAATESLRDLERLRTIAHDLERVVAEFSAVLKATDARLRPGAAPIRPSTEGHRPDAEGLRRRSETPPPDSGADQPTPESLRPGTERYRPGSRPMSVRPLRPSGP